MPFFTTSPTSTMPPMIEETLSVTPASASTPTPAARANVEQAIRPSKLGGHLAEEGARELTGDVGRGEALPRGAVAVHAEHELRRAAVVAVEEIHQPGHLLHAVGRLRSELAQLLRI